MATVVLPKSFVVAPEFNDLSTSRLARGFCTIKQVNYRLFPTYRIQANNYELCGVTSWFGESSSLSPLTTGTSQAGFGLKGRRHRHNYMQNNELQSEVADATRYERPRQSTNNALFMLLLRFPVIKSLRTNEDTYATLICSPGNKNEEEEEFYQDNDESKSQSTDSSAEKVHNDVSEKSDGDVYASQKQQSESVTTISSNAFGVRNARRPSETDNNLKHDDSNTEPLGEESDRMYQVSVLPPPEMPLKNHSNLHQPDRIVSRLPPHLFNNDEPFNGTQALSQTSSNNPTTLQHESKIFSVLPVKQQIEGSAKLKPAKSASDLGESRSFIRHHKERTLPSIYTIDKNDQQEHVTNRNENNSTSKRSCNIWPPPLLLTFIFSLLVMVLIFAIIVYNLSLTKETTTRTVTTTRAIHSPYNSIYH